MKKIFFAAAVVGVALTGCVSNEPEIAPKGDSKITFAAPLVSGISRAVTGEINNPYPDTELFTAFAKFYRDGFSSWTAGEWYFGQTGGVDMKYNSDLTGWAPSDGTEYYWPKNGSLTFYAYSPADYETWKPAITSDEQMNAAGVNIPAEAANVDLMYSDLAKNKHVNDNTPDNNGTAEYYGVELKFKHALSSIQFKVKLSRKYDNAVIVLNKIVLKQAKSQGTFSWGLKADAAPAWNSTAPLDYTVVSGAAQNVISVETADAVAQAKPMILLPQALTGVIAEVTYTINEREFTSEIKLAELKHGEQSIAEWQPGKRYIYTITFSLNTIYSDPTVANWDTIDVTYPNPDETAGANA